MFSNLPKKAEKALQDYASIELDHAKDLAPLFATPCAAATIATPPDQPPLGTDGIRVTRDHRLYNAWKYECDNYNERNATLETNLLKLFTVVLLQCSPGVKLKLESTAGYAAAKLSSDCMWLITTLKNICHQFEETEHRFTALVAAKSAIFTHRQNQGMTTPAYFDTFNELLTSLESHGGRLHDPLEAFPKDPVLAALTTADERQTHIRERYCAAHLIRNSDNSRFLELKNELATSYLRGRDEYPLTIAAAQSVLLKYEQQLGPIVQKTNRTPTGPNTRGNPGGRFTPNPRGRGLSAGRTGGQTGRSFVQVHFCLAHIDQHFENGIPNHYVLLDSDSTVSIFCNADLLTDIHEVDQPLYLETNGGGYQVSTQMGTIKDFGTVWYNPNSIANILSLAQVRLVRRVTMDTADSPAFHVHKLDGSGTTVFAEHASGLYLYDASAPVPHVANSSSEAPVIAYSYLQTVAHNKTKFTARQIESADAARKLYRLLGRPGYTRFLTALKDNHILNCPVTIDDARRAEQIYGKDVAFLKGKTTESPAKAHVPDFTPVALPPEMLSLHPNITLCCDLFYVLGLTFSLSTSRNLRYLSCRHLADRSLPSIKQSISSDLSLYRTRGFTPVAIHADGEFAAAQSAFPDINFAICSADDHVPEIERAIRTVKETIRSTIHGMPFSRLPRVLVKELAIHAIHTINMLPHPDGVSPTLSPATIITGQPKPDFRNLQLEFGTYVQVFDGTSNDTKSRTLGAIATNPTGNSSGDYYFMSLATGQRIHRRSWIVLPISDAVISRVEAIASNDNMPLVDHASILTEYDPTALVDIDHYDRDYVPPVTPDTTSDHDLTSYAR